MIIRSRESTYEVIERLPDGAAACHFRCRCAEDGAEYHLAGFTGTSAMAEGPAVLELAKNPAFTELKEYFVEREALYLVFPYPAGSSLAACLEEKTDWAAMERFSVGQGVLERIILLQIPDWLLGGVLEPEAIYPEQEPVGFYYFYTEPDREKTEWEGIQAGIAGVAAGLLGKEIGKGRYPEIEAFLKRLEDGAFSDMMEIYRAYLELMPVCGEDRSPPKAEKIPLRERLKKWGKRLLTAFKLLMGAAVLISAVTVLPRMWKEQVQPVAQAAALWKAVYVDGETLEAETEKEAKEEAEPGPGETEAENGQVTWYWDNGSVCYKGTVADGMYEGRGTLYYPHGGIAYQGDFEFGRKHGEGSLYTEEGILLYDGGFKRDQYEGEGKLYDKDNGNLIYEGGFSGGKYDGAGVLFDKWSEFPVYDGTFRLGYYDGKGVEYDSSGAPRYEGEFLLGVYHGHGVYYDARTGLVLMEGEFRNGNLVLMADLATGSDADMPEGIHMEGGNRYEGTDNALVVPEAG